MTGTMRPGDTFADRYRLVVLLHERSGGRFWRAWDTVLARHVALHVIAVDDRRAPLLQDAARRSATVQDPHLLRVLDTDETDGQCYVVNEWGEGTSLNHLVYDEPLTPLRGAWLIAEVAQMIAAGHARGVAHGRLVPENVLLDSGGAVKVIGFAVDAALHGLPPGREGADLTDLAGLLHCALTGRWAGLSISQVPMAPVEHGRPLRPRQVRAGVPRMLDAICEDVLSGGGQIRSAGDFRAALLEYVGDPVAVAQAESERAHGSTSPRLPRVEDPAPAPRTAAPGAPAPAHETPETPEHADAEVDEVEPTPAPQTPAPVPVPPSPVEETQPGVPVFFDELGEVGWHSPEGAVPPPPPPFEEPPERPLFAPDPPGGRVSRLPPAASDENSYWPFGGDSTAHTIVGVPVPATSDPVPGRSWLRVAALIGAVLVMLMVSIWAFSRGESNGPGGSDGSESPSGTGTANAGQVIAGVTADDFDPFGTDGEEYPARAKLTVDGKADTSWITSEYLQQLGPAGLKPGVGLVLDLLGERQVSRVTVTVGGGSHTMELRTSASGTPDGLEGLKVVATETSDDGVLTFTLDEPVTTGYLVLWLTELPARGGQFRGQVIDVEVRG